MNKKNYFQRELITATGSNFTNEQFEVHTIFPFQVRCLIYVKCYHPSEEAQSYNLDVVVNKRTHTGVSNTYELRASWKREHTVGFILSPHWVGYARVQFARILEVLISTFSYLAVHLWRLSLSSAHIELITFENECTGTELRKLAILSNYM